MYLKIDGVDITDYIAYNGLKWQRNDVESPNAGRTLAGTMVRDRVATKIRLDVKCRPLTSDELRVILNLINPVYITVEYNDPRDLPIIQSERDKIQESEGAVG